MKTGFLEFFTRRRITMAPQGAAVSNRREPWQHGAAPSSASPQAVGNRLSLGSREPRSRIWIRYYLPGVISLLLLASTYAAELPPWSAKSPTGETVRIAVPAPSNPRFAHLSWPKAVRTADGTIILGYLAGTHHGDESCPAVSLSTDGGGTFTAPNVLREFGPGQEYTNSGNMALGVAHDGAVVLLAHGHTAKTNHIFGWRSADSGRTWQPVDTSALGPNKTGSSTGAIVQLPGKQLMVTGHYRTGSHPFSIGIWQSISADDGLTWGEPQMVNNLNAGEPTLVRNGDQLLTFIRGRGPAAPHQFVSISDDWGQTWRTELLNVTAVSKGALLTHPCALLNPQNQKELIDVTFERGSSPSAQLWRGDAKTLKFKNDRTLLELPKIPGDPNTDYGYAWLLPMEGSKALVFYYHGQGRGSNPIWVLETKL